MAKNGVFTKFSVHHLDFMEQRLPSTGGRLMSSAGEMAQIIANEAVYHIVYIEFQPDGRPRGNHYHLKMTHGIYIIKGTFRVILVDLEDDSRAEVSLAAGDLIRIKPNCAHVFIAQEYGQALELNSTPYNPADTIPYIIEAPSDSLRSRGDNNG